MFSTSFLSRVCLLCLLGWLTACSAVKAPSSPGWQAPGASEFEAFATAPVLLLGEQHDAPEQHRIQTELVTWLTANDRLGALVLEMAELGRSTQGLPASASEAEVKTALTWADTAWPWDDYRGAVMAAVRAGVPVIGANLNRTELRAAMGNTTLEAALNASALRVQDERMRSGHCGMLPERQIRPMTRVQIARDQAMAKALLAALAEDRPANKLKPSTTPRNTARSVLLLAGHGHVDKTVGIPLHMALPLRVARMQAGGEASPAPTIDPSADLVWLTPALPPTDYCAGLTGKR
jgi:uncharacterized iron-regulated protein